MKDPGENVLAIAQGIGEVCMKHTDKITEQAEGLATIAGGLTYFIALFTDTCDPDFRRMIITLLEAADAKQDL